MADETNATTDQAADADNVDVQDAELPRGKDEQIAAQPGQIDILMDTAIPVSAQLGQVEMEVREVLQVGPGSVVKLDKRAGQPIDLFLRGVRFATGDLVVIGEQLGVRVREVLATEGAGKHQNSST